mmetsp:Transcript_978/g.2328  ORF Transcript_978/g.2328 Transcript_978/m.2328 type:complete len:504 (-) Transcript_978:514-2025(-)
MGCVLSKNPGRDLSEVEVIFFDMDDTLYQNNWATAERLKESIERYTVDDLGLDEGYAFQLYLEHGTALRGLLKMNLLPEDQIEHFLQKIHDVSLEEIEPNPALAKMLKELSEHKRIWIFTASIKEHAQRCLAKLGIPESIFEGIIDSRSVGLVTKHSPMAFVQAMEIANVTEGHNCMFFDDSVKNIKTAKQMGWHTCTVGRERGTGEPLNCPDADFAVDSVMELPEKIPDLFLGERHNNSVIAVQDATTGDASDPYSAKVVEDESDDESDDGKHEEVEPEDSDVDIDDVLMEDEVEDEVPEAQPRHAIFILGGPGSGKGTQSQKLQKKKKGDVVHLSAGDLLRAELQNPDSEYGPLIDKTIKEGGLVPEEITMKLIVKAFEEHPEASTFLIDGCPRDLNNLKGWYKFVQDPGYATVVGALFYDTSEEVMLERIMGRAATSEEQRSDDNEETARKRFKTFEEKTMPLMDKLRAEGLVRDIDASRPVDEVFKDTVREVNDILKDQ